VVNRGARIKAGDRVVTFKDLEQYKNEPVSVRFVPEHRSDVAKSIRIGG
jgi:hypothetical protein